MKTPATRYKYEDYKLIQCKVFILEEEIKSILKEQKDLVDEIVLEKQNKIKIIKKDIRKMKRNISDIQEKLFEKRTRQKEHVLINTFRDLSFQALNHVDELIHDSI